LGILGNRLDALTKSTEEAVEPMPHLADGVVTLDGHFAGQVSSGG
jgi:hypothetical protein